MCQALVFSQKSINIENLVKEFSLNFVFTNTRTTIYENDNMRLSIDDTVMRVLVFEANDYKFIDRLKRYFYGDD